MTMENSNHLKIGSLYGTFTYMLGNFDVNLLGQDAVRLMDPSWVGFLFG